MQDPHAEEKHNFNTNTMSELKVSGKIEKILPVESGTSQSGKDWKKQGFIINTGADFNPTICFSVFGDEKVQKLSENKEGDNVEVSFNVSSREWANKEGKVSYFHNLDAWKIVPLVANNAPTEVAPNAAEDDLPF